MMSTKISLIMVAMLLPLLFVPLVFAGTTGKISGQVVEKDTGSPLPGANIVVTGTTFGAASDLEGYFTILHLPPGTYTVETTMMGYTKISVSDVRVRIDQTSKVNFELTQETISGEEITIVAEKNIVREDVATSVVAISANEVRSLPYNNVTELAGLQAGIQEDLEIRGGGAEESLFQVDGITLRDPRNNQPITGIPLSAIKELSIERGGFNAEYGQVRAGLINVVTQEGSKSEYHFTIQTKYSPPQEKHFGISVYDRNSMWLRPYLDPDVAFVGTENGTWDSYLQRQYPQFDGWNEISRRLLSDDNPSNDLSPLAAQRLFEWEYRQRAKTDQPDYNIDLGFGGPMPFISEQLGDLRFFTAFKREREMLLIPLSRDDYLEYQWFGQLTSDLSESKKIKFTSMYGKSFNVAINRDDIAWNGDNFGPGGQLYWNPTDYVRTPFEIAEVTDEARSGRIFTNSWYSQAEVQNFSLAGQFTNIISPSTFYEVRLEHVRQNYTTGPIAARDTSRVYEIIPGYFVDEAPFGFDPAPNTGIDGSFFGGHTSQSRDSTKTSSTTFKFDLTSQVNFNNLVKAGVEIVYNDLNLNYGAVNQFFGDVNYVIMEQNPIRGALYIQDKLEAKGFIVNAGLRLDYSDANTKWVKVDQFDKSFYTSKFNPDGSYPEEDAEAKISLSPRLSISHPITDNSKLFFNYGHFNQLPTYEEVFRLGRGIAGNMRNYGNPNLGLAKTVSYELGYDHVLFEQWLIQLAGFYHDITDQQLFTTFNSADGSIGYTTPNNDSYEDIRGFEFTVRKTAGEWFTGFANYTYQVNTSGQFGKAQIFEDPSAQRDYDRNTTNLYQQRPDPRPYGRVNLFFTTPEGFGPEVLGTNPFSDWTLNLIGAWRAGEKVTWNPVGVAAIRPNIRVRDFKDVTLRLNKSFNFGGSEFIFFVEVNNLFNTKRLSGASFYNTQDWIDYMSSLHLPESDAYDNIKGTDKAGDFRDDDVEYQPIERIGLVTSVPVQDIRTQAIYYEISSGKYMQFTNDAWSEVDKGTMNKILDNKAYIDMPNQTSFNFLNPRQIFIGLRTSFNL